MQPSRARSSLTGLLPLATLVLVGACASGAKPALELVGAPSIVTPQRPPEAARYDTVGTGAATPVSPVEVTATPLPAAATAPTTLPTLEEIVAPQKRDTAAAAMTVEAAPLRPGTPVATPTPVAAPERPVRNPSFSTRVPVKPAPAAPRYRRLSARELTDRIELQASFQVSSPAFDAAPSRVADAAAILRVNPEVVVRVTGFALETEQGGRTLAQRRAEMLARELTDRGAGSARIETEGRLVRLGKASTPAAKASVERAARRAQVIVISGTPRVDPFEPQSVPPLPMR